MSTTEDAIGLVGTPRTCTTSTGRTGAYALTLTSIQVSLSKDSMYGFDKVKDLTTLCETIQVAWQGTG